jgi:hypothetical protein
MDEDQKNNLYNATHHLETFKLRLFSNRDNT